MCLFQGTTGDLQHYRRPIRTQARSVRSRSGHWEGYLVPSRDARQGSVEHPDPSRDSRARVDSHSSHLQLQRPDCKGLYKRQDDQAENCLGVIITRLGALRRDRKAFLS